MKFTSATPALVLFVLLLQPPLAAQDAPLGEGEPPKRSVLLFIGDGMGVNQVRLGRVAARELARLANAGEAIPKHLEGEASYRRELQDLTGSSYNIDRFLTKTTVETRSYDYLVTDSAAAATALATGWRTNNHAVGVRPFDKSLPDDELELEAMETLIDLAHENGYRTGVVSNMRLTHATPAAFVAHVAHRNSTAEIARQITEVAKNEGYPEVLIGGGFGHFFNAKRKIDHLSVFAKAGYEIQRPGEELVPCSGKLLALQSHGHMPYRIDEASAGLPTLEKMAATAVGSLGEGPFFAMIEGGRIDYAGHAHDMAALIHEQLDFDRALGWALEEARRRNRDDNPNNDLLIVVTADHSTGGLTITNTVTPETVTSLLFDAQASVGAAHKLAGSPPRPKKKKPVAGVVEALDGEQPPKKPSEIEKATQSDEQIAEHVEAYGRKLNAALAQIYPKLAPEGSENWTEADDKWFEHGPLSKDELTEVYRYNSSLWRDMRTAHAVSRRYGATWNDPEHQFGHLENTHGHDGTEVLVLFEGPGAKAFTRVFQRSGKPPLNLSQNYQIAGQITVSLGWRALNRVYKGVVRGPARLPQPPPEFDPGERGWR